MDNIVPKPKTVNLEKLNALSEAQLTERISKSAEKVAQKRQRYEAQHKLNMARLAAYETYRKADSEACKKILAERKTKSSLPPGNSQAVTKTA
jgi:hypothetical protein